MKLENRIEKFWQRPPESAPHATPAGAVLAAQTAEVVSLKQTIRNLESRLSAEQERAERVILWLSVACGGLCAVCGKLMVMAMIGGQP